MNIKSLGQWQWLVWWAPLWVPFALLMIWVFYREIFVNPQAIPWLIENVLFW